MDGGQLSIKGASAKQLEKLNEIIAKFSTNEAQLVEVSNEVYSLLVRGLQTDDNGELSSVVSFVGNNIADLVKEASKAKKTVLGVNINTAAGRVKIASIHFEGPRDKIVNKQVFFTKESLADADRAFDFVTASIADFVNTHGLVPERGAAPLPLGVSIDQRILGKTSIGDGVVCTGSSRPGIFEGVDIGLKMNRELNKKHLPLRVVSVDNCVISTLVTSTERIRKSSVAVILNHGVNASYYDSPACMGKINNSSLRGCATLLAVNTELARFGARSKSLAKTMWDNGVDRESDNPGDHVFEKLVADKYLGEIVRALILDFMDGQLLFSKSVDVAQLNEPYSFYTSYMAVMDDSSDELGEVGLLLKSAFNIDSSITDRQIVREICRTVSFRAARLVAAAVAAIIKKSAEAGNPAPPFVSISGQLTEMNQGYLKVLTETAANLSAKLGVANPEFHVLGEDGYSVGAALTSLF